MKRMHIHIVADDLEASTAFYTALFGQGPTVSKPDYAKWRIDNPRVNLAVSATGSKSAGIEHVGIEVDTDEERAEIETRLRSSEVKMVDEADAHCCYAHSQKHWTADPQNVVWEIFQTEAAIEVYGDETGPEMATATCCG
ncbi:MAG: ArsI/CadI family heavy metal resistance metalloenzyme [Pseudomonadota bacterium]